jgi:chromosome segregation ATPase
MDEVIMSGQAENFLQEVTSFERRVHEMLTKTQLQTTLDKLEDLQAEVLELPTRLKKMRQQGYVFNKDLEAQVASLGKQWQALHPDLRAQVQEQVKQLQSAMRPLEAHLNRVVAQKSNPTAGRPLLANGQLLAETLSKKIEIAQTTVEGMYDAFEGQADQVASHFKQVEWMLTQLAEASFTLLPTESGIMAVKAVWCAETKERAEDPDGVLYLTDQRLIFEQKEEVATRKILFITTAKKKIQEMEWALPISLLETVQVRKMGMLKNEDYLDLHFAPTADRQTIYLHIWESAETWQALLNKAKTQGFDASRISSAVAAAKAATPQNVPTICPSCGAQLSQTVLRGQQTIACQYCGNVVRL